MTGTCELDRDDEFDRARFEESLELARDQLALCIEIDDEREVGS